MRMTTLFSREVCRGKVEAVIAQLTRLARGARTDRPEDARPVSRLPGAEGSTAASYRR
jgi:hypothetical protein